MTVTSSYITGNQTNRGGGIASRDAVSLTVANSVIAGNLATNAGRGGGIWTNTTTKLTNCTVAGNRATDTGGGVYVAGANGAATLSNTIVTGNSSPGTADVRRISGDGATVTGNNNLLGGFTNSGLTRNQNGNIEASAQNTFVYLPTTIDPNNTGANYTGTGWDLRLKSGSPALDVGRNSSATDAGLATDLDGKLRIWNGIVDIGAYESGSKYRLTGITPSTDSPQFATRITTTLTPSGATATYQWYRSSTSSGPWTAITSIGTSAYYEPTIADYGQYLRVVATAAATGNYSGTVERILSSPVDDRYVGNNSFATATNLGTITTIKIENNLQCNNDDYYKFTIDNDGVKGSLVKINPVTTGVVSQQLVLRVYNSNQQEIGYVSNTTGELVVSLETAKAGAYYIRVSRAGTGTNGYSLTIAPFDDKYEDNDTFDKPAPLSAQSTNIARREVLPIIRQETFRNLCAFDDDWYKFETFGIGDANSFIEIEYTRSAGILYLQLYNSSNVLMYTASNTFTRDGKDVLRMTLNNNILSPGMYYIKVSGINTGTYDLTINPPERSVITDVEPLRPNGAALSGGQVFLRTIPINHTDSSGNDIGRKDFSFTIDYPGDLNSKITVQTWGAENGRISLLDSYGGLLDYQDIFAANTMITAMTTTVEASENGTVTVSTTESGSYNWGVGVKTGVSGWKFNLELSGNYSETHGTSSTITQSSQYGIKIGQTTSYKFDMPAAEFSLAGFPAGDYILRFESGVIDPETQKGYSAIISTNVPVATPPVTPTITTTPISSDTVLLSWEIDPNAKDYQVDFKEASAVTYLEDYAGHGYGISYDTSQPGKITVTVTGLNAGTEYDFQLIASNNAGESVPAIQSVTTLGSIENPPTNRIFTDICTFDVAPGGTFTLDVWHELVNADSCRGLGLLIEFDPQYLECITPREELASACYPGVMSPTPYSLNNQVYIVWTGASGGNWLDANSDPIIELISALT
ncbi:MAG: fibronectin type III domain-containing protein, partial [Planctomycetaceae bacterium]|nr:fibronectin type III domain-containing protein [Planctomycetaceae bacterium]